MRRRILALACSLTTLSASAAGAQVQTWGGERATGSAPATATGSATAPATGSVRTPGAIGLKYTLEGIEVRGNRSTFPRVVLRYIAFHPGDVLDVDDPELALTRFRLLGTGFFRDVQLSLRRGTRRGYVVLVVDVVERNTIVVDGVWLGLSEDVELQANGGGSARPITAYGGAAVTETNLAGSGIALGGAFAVAENQIALRARLTDPQIFRSTWVGETELLYNSALDFFGNRDVRVGYAGTGGTSPTDPNATDPLKATAEDYAVAQYKRFGGRLGFGHDVGISSQVSFDYRVENIQATLPVAASDHRGLDVEPIDFLLLRDSSILSTLRATFVHDTRDEPFLPTEGRYIRARAEASLAPLGSDYPYTKLVIQASQWLPLPWGHVLHLEGFAGALFGDAPVFERFYVGDLSDLLPDRVLDLNFDRRPAPNLLDTDIVEIRYGDYAAKIDTEYRIPVYRGRQSIYGIDFYASVGLYGLAGQVDLEDPPRGYRGLSRVPLDLTFDLGLRIDTQAGGFVLGLGSLIGFVPFRGPTGGAVR